MKRGPQRTGVQSGFTIIETMIVLAVTGLLFVLIAATWAGRQRENEFKTASTEIRSRIQQAITDVQNGYFPGNGDFTCQIGANDNLQLSGGSQNQGTNDACVFLGKLVVFGNSAADGVRIFPVAALRNPTDPTNFRGMKPTVLAPGNSTIENQDMVDLSASRTLQYGLTVYKMQAQKSPGAWVDVNGVGFLSRNGALSQGSIVSGSQPIDLYAIAGTVTSLTDVKSSATTTYMNTHLTSTSATNSYYKNVPIKICFQSGGTNKFALVTLGYGGRQLQPDMQLVNDCGMG